MQHFLTRLRQSAELRLFLFIGLSGIWCLFLLFFRAFISHRITFYFLVWNLFLAFVPWALSLWARHIYRKGRRRYILLPILATWLVFFPNAPYILTDLFHLYERPHVPLWFDLLLILSFAWTGLWMGMISLRYMHQLVAEYTGPRLGWLFAFTVLLAAGFGVYIGRFLRWNSWDLATRPLVVGRDLLEHFIYPLDHLRTWGMTLIFGALLVIMYTGMHLLAPVKESQQKL